MWHQRTSFYSSSRRSPGRVPATMPAKGRTRFQTCCSRAFRINSQHGKSSDVAQKQEITSLAVSHVAIDTSNIQYLGFGLGNLKCQGTFFWSVYESLDYPFVVQIRSNFFVVRCISISTYLDIIFFFLKCIKVTHIVIDLLIILDRGIYK